MARRKKKRSMTDLSFTQLPLMAGSAVASSAGRLGGWTLSRYMRAPLASTAILAMVVLSLAGAAHALYFEQGKHPAPLFKPAAIERGADRPVPHAPAVVAPKPAPRPAGHKAPTVSSLISGDTTGSLERTTAETDAAVGNPKVAAVQRKLARLDFFKAEVDGYYGPKTADAIRAFEHQAGMKPVGSLTPDVVQAILDAPMVVARTTPVVAAAPTPAPQPAQLAAAPAAQQPPRPLAPIGQGGAEPNLHPQKLALGPSAQPLPPPAAAPVPAAEIHMVGEARAAAPPEVTKATASMPLSATGPTPAAALPLAATQNPAGRWLKAADRTAVSAIDTVTGLVGEVTGSADAPAAPVKPNVSTTDPKLVSEVQRGLASLGFLAGKIDGVANESTAKAIRNFEVYYDYPVSGRVTPELVGLLKQAGAVI
jgi:peptidoglycan hydrolase-like protein with peptidoglycan-binding domain